MENQNIASILPETFEGRQSLIERFQDDPVKAMQSYRELERVMGATTRVPAPDATPEEWVKFHKKMGVPEDPASYGVPESKDQAFGEFFNGLRDVAKDAGIPKGAFDKLAAAAAEIGNTRVSTQEKAQTEQQDAAAAQLTEAFGEEVGAAQAKAAEMLKRLNDGEAPPQAMLNDPALVKMLMKVSEIVSEDQLTSGLGGVPDQPNAVEIAARGREIQSSGELENKQNADRKQLYAEYLDILAALEEQGYNSLDDPRLMPDDPFAKFR